MTSRLLISAAHKSSGKTTIALGLCAALRERQLKVQPFKKGPDYIDPMWLTEASGNPCYNLDFYTMDHDEILSTMQRHCHNADLVLICRNAGGGAYAGATGKSLFQRLKQGEPPGWLRPVELPEVLSRGFALFETTAKSGTP